MKTQEKNLLGLTERQERAVTSEASRIAVVAAAGSGKTRVLVERYLHAVLARGISPEKIIAITYTNKAADEMRTRIRGRLDVLGKRELSAILNAGTVNTIHGFCLKLLKENPIEAGLDPQFGVLEDEFAYVTRSEIAEAVLDEAYARDREKYMPLFTHAGPDAIRESLLSVYERWRSRGGKLEAQCVDVERLRDATRRKILSLNASGWMDIRVPDADETYPAALDEAIAALKKIRKKDLKDAADDERESCEYLSRQWIDVRAFPANRLFIELIEAFDARYVETKRKLGLIDVDDQLFLTLKLLTNEHFRKRFAARHAMLLVDEFQDVNALQAALIRELARDIAVFFVGDARQSIYGFRYAEPREFVRMAQEFEAGKGEFVALDMNFRSQNGLGEFINDVFEPLEAEEGAAFGRFQTGREAADHAPATVLFRTVEAKERIGVTDLRREEADRLARTLHNFIQDKPLTLKLNDKAPRPAVWRDVVILLRAMTSSDIYEKALEQYGIPYHVIQGRGFYYRSEILDILNALLLLARPEDSVALASVLKSPLVGVTDETLFWIFGPSKKTNEAFFEKSWEKSPLADSEKQRLSMFCAWFSKLNARKNSLGLSALIQCILDETQFEAVQLSREGGLRRYSNVMKLKEKAGNYEKYMGHHLAAFVAYVKDVLWNEEVREAEAAVSTEADNVVRIMTVHASKGLEFPIVCIADMGAPQFKRNDTGVFVMSDGLCVSSGMAGEVGGARVRGELVELALRERKLREERESLRLLYVAMTRATEHLVLSGTLKKPAKPNPDKAPAWMEVVEESLQRSGRRGLLPEPVLMIPSKKQQLLENKFAVNDVSPGDLMQTLENNFKSNPKRYFQTLDLSISSLVDFRSGEPVVLENKTSDEDGKNPLAAEISGAAAFGTVFHEILQHTDYGQPADREWERLSKRLSSRLDPDWKEELKRSHAFFLNHELIREFLPYARKPAHLYRELPFMARIKNDERDLGFLRGQVDLLFFHPEQGWVLIDYKTSRGFDAKHDDQVRIYAHCLRRLMGGKPDRAYLYYSRLNEFREVDLGALAAPAFEQKLITDYEAVMRRVLE